MDRSIEEQLGELFGGYRAEWLRERLFDLFTKPSYFPAMESPRPCFLIGGRGTGKTTVLRCLSYEGRFALQGNDAPAITAWPYFGFYHRVNTNRVTAFRGPEADEQTWIRLFAHYMNLLLCQSIVRFIEWYEVQTGSQVSFSESDCHALSACLHLEPSPSFSDFSSNLFAARIQFEARINNIADGTPPGLSMQGQPVDVLMDLLQQKPQFRGKNFYFLIDEYENFEAYQQRVVNTLIKHSGSTYSFKVGVRELGIKERATLNSHEQLISPSDYVRINVAESLTPEVFRSFALSVCNERISRLELGGQRRINTISELLPGLSEDAEAELLGVRQKAQEVIDQIVENIGASARSTLEAMSPLEIYLLSFWAEGQKSSVPLMFEDYLRHPKKWQTRYGNYKHALLYTIRRGKRGIQKHYAGWDTFTQLAAGNIRYLLELVDQSLLLYVREAGELNGGVPTAIQTEAAQRIGKKNLAELEGLSVHGAQLTKLLLGLGRVFQVMAADAAGHAPEINQFDLQNESGFPTSAETILNAAVMHLALIRFPGNKLGNVSDIRDYDYMLHPIYSAFFVFSYRRKRKMTLRAERLLGLVETPRDTIKEILSQNNRAEDVSLPDQLNLFETYYDEAS